MLACRGSFAQSGRLVDEMAAGAARVAVRGSSAMVCLPAKPRVLMTPRPKRLRSQDTTKFLLQVITSLDGDRQVEDLDGEPADRIDEFARGRVDRMPMLASGVGELLGQRREQLMGHPLPELATRERDASSDGTMHETVDDLVQVHEDVVKPGDEGDI